MKYKTKEGLYYTKEHEWLNVEDGTGTVGLSHYAAEELGDIAYIELPKPGKVTQGGKLCEIESVKAVSDIYAPVSGLVVEVNNALTDSPELINQDSYAAWICKIDIEDKKEIEKLMSAQEYATYVESLT
ncbi:MAG: glycine cleavage system protein GcvH [Theionarchaea archaeon]|nr:glycine cleavage system protein GcvH [Theionarchaea archaeon]MBU7038037.1 glycine cleavage system protein GcvH [Theionarchaea archaeon]